MAKRAQRNPISLQPAGSKVRPRFRRAVRLLWHSGRLQAALLALVAGWGIYDAIKSPRYHIRTVEAKGVQALTTDEVTKLAGVTGQLIWLVEPADIVERVRQSPYVEHADAHLVLPDRLEVTIVERKPNVRWIHDGTAFAVTWEGLIVDGGPTAAPPAPITATGPLSPTDGTPTTPPPLPEVSILEIVDTTPNRPLKVGDQVDADALELARRVMLRAPTELPVPIGRIEWDGGLGVSLIFGDNRQAVLGRSDDLDRKLATLRFLLQDTTPFTYLDLRPTTPYYR
jgi:cell division protein FtsQ